MINNAILGVIAGQRIAAAGGDPYWANVIALLHLDSSGPIVDETGLAWTLGGGTIDTTTKKFGAGSYDPPAFAAAENAALYSGNEPSTGYHDFTGDFTVEAQVYPVAHSGYQMLVTRQVGGISAGIAFQFRITPSGTLELVLRETSPVFVLTGATVVPTGQWSHVVAQRISGVCTLYLQGVSDGSASSSFQIVSGLGWGVGYLKGGFYGDVFTGLIDEVRITKDVGRYPSNFTPPTAEFPYP